ncbi:carbon-nitrogen hydrolase family protein [Rugosimonospora africana]|uniref:CN hydrolase domain-containing protein n=1 Tax=Rugosimonospora africana TaxID=556532 RepID=A0A8J3VQF5_9ACTN|nr:carbon-nitrogen hydrolase family protein [Rugosimonospora africana]GIH14997.1 hypothetical protein Raf01_31690 [Rugosimonospora africana]
MPATLRIAACQTPEILGDVPAALTCVGDFAQDAERRGAELLLFPECFLQGYLVEPGHLRRHALDLRGAEFATAMRRLRRVRPTIVLGLIERDEGTYYNSAVVVSRGELLGRYRKTQLVTGESLFAPGDSYPTFDLGHIRFGINICYDTQFPAAAGAVAAQGARLLLVPAQNMMRRPAAERWKNLHNQIRAARVRETGMWLASADVTGQRGEERVGYGPTCVMNPQGQIVAQVPMMTTGMAVADVR